MNWENISEEAAVSVYAQKNSTGTSSAAYISVT